MARDATVLLALACGEVPRGEPGVAASPPAGPDAPGAATCVGVDRMPRLPIDSTRDYTLRVVPPDTSRRYAMRDHRVPLCPADSVRARALPE